MTAADRRMWRQRMARYSSGRYRRACWPFSNYIEDLGDRKQAGTWYGIFGSVQNGNGSMILGNKILQRSGRAGRCRPCLYR